MPRARKATTPTAAADGQGAVAVAETAVEAPTVTANETDTVAPVESGALPAEAPTVHKAGKKNSPIALKCSVNQAQLKAALGLVRGSLPTRKSLPNPAIGLYKLVADRGKKRLSITTYNEVVATTVDVPANVVVEGELLVSKDLGELVAELPEAGITLSAETASRLQVIMDSRTFSPKSMSAAGYPDLVGDDEAVDNGETGDEQTQIDQYTVSTESIRRALEFVCPGALTEGGDAETSIFNAVRLDLWHGKKMDVFAVAASDDGCLLVDETTAMSDATLNIKLPQATVCIPVKSCQILLNLLNQALEDEAEEMLTIALLRQSEQVTLCRFSGGGKRLLTHLVTGAWPNYREKMPPTEGLFQAQVIADRELLLSLVNCNLVFAMAKSLRTMMFDAFSRDSVISTWVKTQSKGESVQEMVAMISALNGSTVTSLPAFGFNTVKVKLALTQFSDTEIRWQFIGDKAPTLLTGGTKGRWIVMMPLAVNENEPEVDETKGETKAATKTATKKP